MTDLINHPDIATQHQTCIACPEQWEGTLKDGRHFYYRLRFGRAFLGIGDTPEDAVCNFGQRYINYGGRLTGMFNSHSDCERTFGELMSMEPLF